MLAGDVGSMARASFVPENREAPSTLKPMRGGVGQGAAMAPRRV